MVPLVTPAWRATSSMRAAAKPFSANTRRAASRISCGRAFFRRLQRCCTWPMRYLITDQSVTFKRWFKMASLARCKPIVDICQQSAYIRRDQDVQEQAAGRPVVHRPRGQDRSEDAEADSDPA